MILYVTGTGTGVGKTAVTRGLARALKAQGLPVIAVKPLETGCDPEPLDATALAAACGQSARDNPQPGFYRARMPLAPYAATLAGEPAPDVDAIVRTCRDLSTGCDPLIVEGAGGLLVPIDRTRTNADLALALGSNLLLVAPDRLGVLSDALAVWECATRRRLTVAAIVLNRGAAPADASRPHNARILAERCDVPVLCFEPCEPTDAALAAEATRCGLIATLWPRF